MPVSQLNKHERLVQARFSIFGIAGAVVVAAIVGVVDTAWTHAPDRFPMAPRTVFLQADHIELDPAAVAPLRLAGAWHLTAPDPRFGGLSALAIDRGGLLALNDNGVSFRFTPPGTGRSSVTIRDIPDGPGSGSRKSHRDSESLAIDGAGRGWWVGFEESNQLWLYSEDFARTLARIDFGKRRWPHNSGIEAMIDRPDGLLLVPEDADEVVTVIGSHAVSEPLAKVGSAVSDMVRLPDGEVLVLMRDVGPFGLTNALGALVHTAAGWRVERRVPLKLGLFMNAEGIAAETLANGGTRLWIVTDDNFRTPLTTALFALDVPSGRWTGRTAN